MNVAQPRVAIAFPTYNGARYLGAAIKCALVQSYRNTEIFVVDDSSSDNTVAIANSFGARVAVHVNEKRRGLGGNWNRCIELSQAADYLLIAHQDDLMGLRLVERAIDLFRRAPNVGFVHSDLEQIDAEGRVIGGHWIRERGRKVAREAFVWEGMTFFERLMDGGGPICCPSMVVRRGLYDQVGLYDETYTFAVDVQMQFRMLLAADVGYLSEPLYQLRWHADQATARHNKAQREADIIRAKLDGLAIAERSGKFDVKTLSKLRRSVARHCCQVARRYALGNIEYAKRHLRHAWLLHTGSTFNEDFIVGQLRVGWASIFGTTAAGRARYARRDVLGRTPAANVSCQS